jgi:hypothetical protein
MSYGFIKTMRENPNQSYVEVSFEYSSHGLSANSLLGPPKHTTAPGPALPADPPVIRGWAV